MPLRKFKKISKSLISYAKPIAFLCLFAYIIVQPHLFAVEKHFSNTDRVQAAYQDLLDNTRAAVDGSLQFETLIVGENGKSSITYTVLAGDNLGSIAKNFGTTIEAIQEANALESANKLKPGQKLIIAYDDGVIVDVKETMSVENFTRVYNIDKEEFLSMNYFEDESLDLEAGWQVFVPLNQIEAEKRGLIDKEAFAFLDLGKPEEPLLTYKQPTETGTSDSGDQNGDNNAGEDGTGETNQIIITAEQTEKHLQQIESDKKNAELAAQEAKRLSEEKARLAKEAAEKAEKEKTIASQRAAEKAAQTAKEAKEKQIAAQARAEEESKKVADAKAAIQENFTATCRENQCLHKDKCRSLPSNASCAPDDTSNAWSCDSGYIESGNKCISEDSAIAQAPKKSTGIIKQWYFNPHKVDSNVFGRGPGHCTAMAAYLWSQNYDIRIRDFWTGNAKDWLANAKNAGFRVDSTPAVGALMVSGNGYGSRGSYGHVMYVKSVDIENGLVTVIDMNYQGRYIATERTEAINKAGGFIHPK